MIRILPIAFLALALPLAAEPLAAQPLAAQPAEPSRERVSASTATVRPDDFAAAAPACCWQAPACRAPVEIVYTAGRPDNFALPIDPAAPRPIFANFLTQMNAVLGGFDDTAANRQLAHTFGNLPIDIQAATLEISLRANAGDVTANDALHLDWLSNVFAWGTYLGSGNSAPGLHPSPWSPGTAKKFELNLAALPAREGKPSCILPTINLDHALDVYVQDDTAVDYAKLTVKTCKCSRKTFSLPVAGKKDAYATPFDPGYRRPELDALRAPPYGWKDFDNPADDRGVGHTFTQLPPAIVEATLKIALRPNSGTTFDSTDAINLFSRIPAGGPPFIWSSHLTSLTVVQGVVELQLDKLPQTSLSPKTNLLGELAAGILDVYIQDDTNVDWMELSVLSCAEVVWAPNHLGIPVQALDGPSVFTDR